MVTPENKTLYVRNERKPIKNAIDLVFPWLRSRSARFASQEICTFFRHQSFIFLDPATLSVRGQQCFN